MPDVDCSLEAQPYCALVLRIVNNNTIYTVHWGNMLPQRHASSSSPTFKFTKTLVQCSTNCIPKTISNSPYRIFLHQLRQCWSPSSPTIWTGDHSRCIPNSAFVNWIGTVWIPPLGLGWKRCDWIHYPSHSDWWKVDVSKRWVCKLPHVYNLIWTRLS